MKIQVELSAQVLGFIGHLAPIPRRQLRAALRDLSQEHGDICPLEGDLAGFYRLRVGRYRVVFWYTTVAGKRVIRCEFAEERSIIYQLFAEFARHWRGPAEFD